MGDKKSCTYSKRILWRKGKHPGKLFRSNDKDSVIEAAAVVSLIGLAVATAVFWGSVTNNKFSVLQVWTR